MINGNTTDVIFKDVVVIGNGPSGLALSFMLSGNLPYLISTSHPDELLSARLNNLTNTSLIQQDLLQLASGIEGRSTNPIALLLDSLIHPYADVGLELNSLIEWRKRGLEIDHVVLGKGPPGGSWHEMDPNILTLSLGKWMALPGLTYKARDGCEKRASAGNVAKYYLQYVKEMQLEKYFQSNMYVTNITRLKDTNVDSSTANENTEDVENVVTEIRRKKMCSLSNAFSFIRFRSNRNCKRRRDDLIRNDSSPDRKIREVLQRSTSLSQTNKIILNSKDAEEVSETVNLCYPSSMNRSTSFSCDFDDFQTSCDSFCGKIFKEQGSFLRSSNSLSINNSLSRVPTALNNCDKDSIRLKKNCDSGTSKIKSNDPSWLVEVYNTATGHYIKYTCNQLILANGTSDLPNKLSISDTTKSPSWLVHDARSLELALDLYMLKNSEEVDPVLIVGAGLSAADAIIATRCRSIPVLHPFRKKHSNLGKQLPENMYPEYHKVHQMMQDGGSTYPLYTALPECSLTDINAAQRMVTVTTKLGEKQKFHVSFAAVLIGTRPDLSFLPKNFNLGVNKNFAVDNKANNVDINKTNYSVNGFENLYALGPLVGDSDASTTVTESLGRGFRKKKLLKQQPLNKDNDANYSSGNNVVICKFFDKFSFIEESNVYETLSIPEKPVKIYDLDLSIMIPNDNLQSEKLHNMNRISQITNNSLVENLDKTVLTNVTTNTSTAILHNDICVKYLIEIKQLCQGVEQQLGLLEKFVFGGNVLQHSYSFSLLATLLLICIDCLLSFEETLEAKEVQLQFAYLIQSIGGINAKDMMKRTLYKVFPNGLAKKCSWTGAKNNFALKNLGITACLKVAVKKNIPDLKEVEFEGHIKIYGSVKQLLDLVDRQDNDLYVKYVLNMY
ncbi:hypothetical protein FQA39_LY05051 [Lamprigera yunnana]|nr:hypothetical protein FQA39_LY05051 [Lamprigera yunnana]